jgi:histidinol phosphatase-like enzyme
VNVDKEGTNVIPAVVFDLDGTVRRSKQGAIDFPSGDPGPPLDAADVELYPGVEEAIYRYIDGKDILVIGATNQGHVGRGKMTLAASNAIQAATRAAFKKDPFDFIVASHAHPEAVAPSGSWNRRTLLRKPNLGMLAVAEFEATRRGFGIDWDHPETVMVGDWTTDSGCAAAAGVRFAWAWDFFGRPAPGRNGPALEGVDLVRARAEWALTEAAPTALRRIGAEAQADQVEGLDVDDHVAAMKVVQHLWLMLSPPGMPFAFLKPVPTALLEIRRCCETLDAMRSMMFWLGSYPNAPEKSLAKSREIVLTRSVDLLMPPPAGLT